MLTRAQTSNAAYRTLSENSLIIASMGAGCFEHSIHRHRDEISKQIWRGPVRPSDAVEATMSPIQVGLLDKTGELDPELLQTVAAVLNVQATVLPLPERSVLGTEIPG
jgi:hypothetical protein